MSPLERIELLNGLVLELLAQLPVASPQPPDRRAFHAELAAFWAEQDAQGLSRRTRLSDLRRALMHAELDLRLADQTLASDLAQLIRNCLDYPAAWQRRHQPVAGRPQVYRPVLGRSRPHWRAALPGMFVVASGPEDGAPLDPQQATGPVLLFGLVQGIEAYSSLAQLHLELCQRLEDPIQGRPLVSLLVDEERIETALQADRLRYEWYADDPLQAQVDCLIDAQRQRVSRLWTALSASTPIDHEALAQAVALEGEAGKRALLNTRYSVLLEHNLPNWLRTAGDQGLAHIMQTMQLLVAAGNSVAAPGILTFSEFHQQHSLRNWARTKVDHCLRNDFGLTYPATDILVHVVHTR